MHTTQPKDRRRELTLFESGRSLSAFLPTGFVVQLERFWKSEYKPLLALGEQELQNELKRKGFEPGVRDYHLRHNFWSEYESVQHSLADRPQPMNMSKVLKHTIAKEVFYREYITDMRRLAWLLSPPPELKQAMEIALFKSIEAMIRLVEIPASDVHGNVDQRIASVVMRAQQQLFKQLQHLVGRPMAEAPLPVPRRPSKRPGESPPAPAKEAGADEKLAFLMAAHEQAEKDLVGMSPPEPDMDGV